MKHIITFHEDGLCTGLKTEALPLHDLGSVSQRRVSHIWPVHPVKRLAFRFIRALAGERGRIAEWCRHWRGPWQVRFAASPNIVAFTHASRRVCIEWEIQQLNGKV